ncbi:MAG TPA: hypothetical protein VMS12_04005, partial [Thermoanaerobaculia bacterium]|nr:hypothetical protein [Thermoanaerobaculia bacterium]
EPQNGTLNDIATSYLTLMNMVRADPGSFHWNRYVAAGIPGFGSAGAAVLSPFVFVPVVLLPFWLFCTGILLLKINLPFFFGYLWLREERLGKIPAAAGAIALSGSGIYAVWWLWPSSNAIALYPALLLLVARLMHGKRISIALSGLLAVSFALSGYVATIAYGAWMALLYSIFLALQQRSLPRRQLAKTLAGAGIGALIASPFILPFIGFLRRTGYLAGRENVSSEIFYPIEHLAAFLDPYRLGNPVANLWYGDVRLGSSNNFVEATIFVGIMPLLLIVPALFHRRGRSRFFWLAFGLIVLGGMFGTPVIKSLLDGLPGLQYSPLPRLRFLLPVSVAYLAACGIAMLMRALSIRSFRYSRPFARLAGVASALAIGIPLAFFAASFYPYVNPALAKLPSSPTVDFLQSQQQPFRIAPFFTYLLPNSSEYYGLEDIRSHFSSEDRYRRILQRVDPGSFGSSGTVITFNSLNFDVRDPFVSFLNVRYLVEQPSIDILRWEVEKDAIPVGPLAGEIEVLPGEVLHRDFDVPEASGIELAIAGIDAKTADGALVISLRRPGESEPVYERRLAGEDLRMSKLNLPLLGIASAGERLQIEVVSRGVRARFLGSEPIAGQDSLFLRFTTSPLILVREAADGRVFENLNVLPRYYPVWDTRTLEFEALLADEAFNPAIEAVLTTAPSETVRQMASISPEARRAAVRILSYTPGADEIETTSGVPFLLASSEKLTPELRVLVDGAEVEPLEINGMFAGVPVSAGTHRVIFERRIGRGWWMPAMIGGMLLGVAAGWEWRKRMTRDE